MLLDEGILDCPEPDGSAHIQPAWHVRIRTAVQNQALGGSVSLFGALMLASVVAYGYQMLVARMLSPADYGVVVTLVSVSYVLNVIQRTIQTAMIKTVATLQNTHLGQVRYVFIGTLRFVALLAAVAFVVQSLASSWVKDFLHLETAAPVILLAFYTSACFLIPVPVGALLGLKRSYRAGGVILLESVARLVVGMSLVAWGLGVNGAVIGYAVGHLAAFVIGCALLLPLLGPKSDHVPRVAGSERLDRYAILVLAINSCLMVLASVDQIAVKHFFSPEVAGNYAVSFVLGRILLVVAMSLGTVIFARSATMHVERRGYARVFAKGLLLMGGIAVLVVVGFLVAPTTIVRLTAGSQYGMAQAYVGLVGIEMTLFALVYVQTYFQISLGKMQVIWPLCVATISEIALLVRYHATIQQILTVLISVMGALLICVSGLSWWILRADSNSTPVAVQPPSLNDADDRKEEMTYS